MFVTEVSFVEGEITSIINVPEGIKSIVCPKNLLFSLEDLPSTLVHLEVPYNYLETIDLHPCKILEHANLSHNNIDILENLPSDLLELNCEFNQLRHLNFLGLTKLKSLNVSNNKITVIENLPDGISDFLMDNNPSIEFRNASVLPDLNKNENKEKEAQQNIDYNEAIHDYFRMKNAYETKAKEMKKRAFKNGANKKEGKKLALATKPKCIHCQRPVGTVFSIKDNRYLAICGDTARPCSLNIEIFKGAFSPLLDLIYMFKEEMDKIKENIIIQKLDTLFDYVSEEKSVEMFKTELENYNIDGQIYKELLDKYEEYHDSYHKMDLIQRKRDKIFTYIERIRGLLEEYKKTENRETLKAAVQLQVDDLLPETRNLRLLNSELMEINQTKHGNGRIENFLFKHDVALSKLDYNEDENPRVIKFNK
jgi:hypothetical protein